ncbi:hypothetical protein JCM16303_006774 [Sporobolomyces ruberrimus]
MATDEPSRQGGDDWSTKTYSTNASFVYSAKFTSPVVDLLAPQPGDHILDLGCGHGSLTLSSLLPSVLPTGRIIGLDSSSSLLSTARAASSDEPDVKWIERDAHDLVDMKEEVESESLDAVFSNAALHWMKKDPKKVIQGVNRVLKPGGRYVGEMGGFLNMIGVRGALHSVLGQRGYDPEQSDPWFFPTPEHYRSLLEQVGFRVESCELVPRPTPLPTGLRGWLETFAFSFFSPLSSPREQGEVIEQVCQLCERDMRDEISGEWIVMYVRLRFKAWKQ